MDHTHHRRLIVAGFCLIVAQFVVVFSACAVVIARVS